MSEFGPVAASLREALSEFYGKPEAWGPGTETTIATNSSLVERRADVLLAMLERLGIDNVEGLRMLDLGCGFGAVGAFLAARGARVTGVDPNAERMEVGRAVAAAHGIELDLTVGKMESLESPDRAFEVVIANNSLCYLVDRERRARALREALRVLRPGGVLALRNPNRWHPVDQFTGLPLVHLLPPGTAVRAARAVGRERSSCRVLSPPAARRELRAAGFVGVAQVAFPGAQARPAPLRYVARYQHFTARRPAESWGQ